MISDTIPAVINPIDINPIVINPIDINGNGTIEEFRLLSCIYTLSLGIYKLSCTKEEEEDLRKI